MCFFPPLSEMLHVSSRGKLVQALRGERTRACRRTGTRLALRCSAPRLPRRAQLPRPRAGAPPSAAPGSAGPAPAPCSTRESSRDGRAAAPAPRTAPGPAPPRSPPRREAPAGSPSGAVRCALPGTTRGLGNSSFVDSLSRASQCFGPPLLRPHPKPAVGLGFGCLP